VLSSGEQFELTHGPYRAVVASVGASLRQLTHHGRDLVRPYGADEVRPRFRGAVLAPWPNRVADGRWRWRGVEQQLAITEPEHASALHGLVCWQDWRPRAVTGDSVELATRIWPQDGYPFGVDLAMTWALSERGLHGSLTATNVGNGLAPFGCGIHPYLVAPTGHVDDWTLHLPAAQRLEVDDRMRLLGPAEPLKSAADFRSARVIGTTEIDHAYTTVTFRDGWSEVVVTDEHGDGVSMGFSERTPWVQVHTSDRPDDPDQHRLGLAVEPMTCPPEALASGVDLVVMEPGAALSVPWLIAAV
jgi:aldose 1-epimerase